MPQSISDINVFVFDLIVADVGVVLQAVLMEIDPMDFLLVV